MKSTTIAYTNKKGQLVIPKSYRAALNIDETVPLSIRKMGKGIYLIPVKSVITDIDTEDTYEETLRQTQGAWGGTKEARSKKRALELKASKERKKRW
ncbi:MAG: AbrB/MazE/SpoVT family DNA-binding domain-containing protein [Candidatus Dojkabacteria bacterium]